MTQRPKITIDVIGQLGQTPCHHGHRPGQSFDFDTDRGRICPMAVHCGFPFIDILRYGGAIPGLPPGQARFCCSDADTAMVFCVTATPAKE